MPKIIQNLRERLLSAAKEMLLREGYAALTMRGVADACGVAVGTMYNYFPSKEMLAASVMLEDWLLALGEVRTACATAPDVKSALGAVRDEVARFSARYAPTWENYSVQGSQQPEFSRRHRLLVRQLADCIQPVLDRCCTEAPPASAAVFLAENVLICVGGSEMSFDDLLAIAARVLGI